MAAYGLRPKELQHLQIRQGRLCCMDERVACRGKTRPRVLRPLPCEDWADGWRLEERFPTQELPPMQPWLGGGYVGHSVQTHLAAYCPWCGDDVVDDALARAARSHRRAAPWNCRGGGSAGASCCIAPG